MEQIEQFIPQSSPFIVGVVSDTHIPDRVGELHPALLAELEDQHLATDVLVDAEVVGAGALGASRSDVILRDVSGVAASEQL